MKQLVLFLILSGLPISAGEIPYLNLDFEVYNPLGTPKGWRFNTRGGEVKVEKEQAQSGQVCLTMAGSDAQGFAVLINSLAGEAYQGKTLVLKGKIKTLDVAPYATFFLRADNKEGNDLAFQNMAGKWPKGTTDWTDYSLEMELPEETAMIVFGPLLVGSGKAWFDSLSIEIDGKPIKQIRPEPVLPSPENLAWIRKNSAVIDGKADEQLLSKMASGKSLVVMGAGSYGTSEFFKSRLEMTRSLVEKQGFSILAIEGNGPETRKLNHYIQTGEGDPKALLAEINIMDWNTEEGLAAVKWMREFHAAGEKDLSIVGYNALSPVLAIENVTEFVSAVDRDFFEKLNKYYYFNVKAVWETFNGPDGRSLADFDTWQREAELVYEHLKKNREKYSELKDPAEVDANIQDALLVLQSADYNKRGVSGPAMIQNLQQVIDSHQDSKIIVWSHNDQVRMDGGGVGAKFAEKYRERLLTIGYAFHEGSYTANGDKGLGTYETLPSEPGSVEWFLKECGQPALFVDLVNTAKGPEGAWLSKSLEFRSIGETADPYAFSERVLAEMFDALVFFQKSTPTHPFGKAQKDGGE